MTLRSLAVPEGLDGLRVDAALSRLFGISRTAAADLAASGGVTLAGVVVGKAAHVGAGTLLEVELPDSRDWQPPPEPAVPGGLTVLYLDADLLAVDKPAGVASHPSPGYEGPTVTGSLTAAGYSLAEAGAAERRGVVHRLDVNTSGVMVLARSEAAYRSLKAQFRDRTVSKRYRTLVQGHPDPSAGTIDAPIDRHPGSAWKFAVVQGGRDSVTHYETLEAVRAASLLLVRLETGRTHQIRVHMAAVRHPCCGDLQYGADPRLAADLGLTRQWLHAAELSLDHPATGSRLRLTSPDPPDLTSALERARELTWA
jgi:23S rRNA pseudouridine1911/1915/1917 synthase